MGEIRFVGTSETRGYPYPVCKKIISYIRSVVHFPKKHNVDLYRVCKLESIYHSRVADLSFIF